MMFRGSQGLSAAQLANIIALMGGNFNANTQHAVTQFYFTRRKGRPGNGIAGGSLAHAECTQFAGTLGAGTGSDRTRGGA